MKPVDRPRIARSVGPILALSLLLSLPLAHAAPPLEFKGFPIGGAADDFRAQFKSAGMCSPHGCMGSRALPFDAPLSEFDWGPTTLDSYVVHFVDDKVAGIDLLFPERDFESVVGALTIKYGKPTTSSVSTLQNAFGATYKSRSVTWQLPDGVIYAAQMVGDTESSAVTLGSKAWLAHDAKHERERIRKAAGKL